MSDLTLMAVHAHPDDEALGTGGTLARYAREGVRTILVTCTNGELGDAPGGVKPGDDGHAGEDVALVRRAELQKACEALGIHRLEMLGYHDSGMMGWPQNEQPGAFWQAPVDEAAKRVAELMERYRPQVVVTYDENGFYGHPDHIQANRVALAASEMTGVPDKLYYTAMGKGAIKRMADTMFERFSIPKEAFDFDPDDPPFGVDDETITTYVDVASFTGAKRAALLAHASQAQNMPMLSLPEEFFGELFGREAFVRHFDRTGAPLPEDDLFAGLR